MKTNGTYNLCEGITHLGKMTLGLLVAVIVCIQLVFNPGFVYSTAGLVLVIMTSVYLVYTARQTPLTAAALGAAAMFSGIIFVGMAGTLLLGLLLVSCGMLMIFTQVWWAGAAAGMAKKARAQSSTPEKRVTSRKARKKR